MYWDFGGVSFTVLAYAEAQGRGTRPAPDIDNSAVHSVLNSPARRATNNAPLSLVVALVANLQLGENKIHREHGAGSQIHLTLLPFGSA